MTFVGSVAVPLTRNVSVILIGTLGRNRPSDLPMCTRESEPTTVSLGVILPQIVESEAVTSSTVVGLSSVAQTSLVASSVPKPRCRVRRRHKRHPGRERRPAPAVAAGRDRCAVQRVRERDRDRVKNRLRGRNYRGRKQERCGRLRPVARQRDAGRRRDELADYRWREK